MKQINDLKRHTQPYMTQLSAAVTRVLERGWYVLGPEVSAFEREFADYCGASSCVSVANGTEALELALRTLGVSREASVASVANAGGYALHAITALGARPAFVDIDDATMNMSPTALAMLLASADKKVAAVIFTHLFGNAASIQEIAEICKQHGVPLIEDCAQAHGAIAASKKAGAWGVLGCFSFYPTKNLGGIGDGGAVTTSDKALAERLCHLRQYGWTKSKYVSEVSGARNSRLDEIQAAVLRLKLTYLDSWNARRREIAARYNAALQDLPLRLPAGARADNAAYVAHLYVVRTAKRDALYKYLKENGIGCDVHYPVLDYRQPSYSGGASGVSLPVSEKAVSEILTLPCFPEMTDGEVDGVVAMIREWAQRS